VDDEMMDFLDYNFLALRHKPRYKNALFVVFIESNADYMHSNRVSKKFGSGGKYGPVYFASYDGKGKNRAGVTTGITEKRAYATTLQLLLTNNAIHFADDMVAPYDPKSKGKTVEQMRKTAIDQLQKYKYHLEVPKDAAKGTFRLKLSGKSYGQPDDVCMDIQIDVYWTQKIQDNPQFTEFCEKHSITL
jgi:hypothetical protein